MLTKVVRLEPSLNRRHQLRALLHELQPQLFRRLETHRVIVRVLFDHVLQFHSQIPPREDSVDGLWGEPVVLLRRHIRRRDNAVVRVDEPQD